MICPCGYSSRRLLGLLRETDHVRDTIGGLQIRDNPVDNLNHVKRLILRAKVTQVELVKIKDKRLN
jgi:hypothetical protein